jgi:putative membrane protein insertion efficiency factor
MTIERRTSRENMKPTPGWVARAMLVAVRIYQLSLSSLTGRYCRHLPTCSQYAHEAIWKHGAWAGFWLAFFRVARCHPWGGAGFDPVPEQISRFTLDLGIYFRAGRGGRSGPPNDVEASDQR